VRGLLREKIIASGRKSCANKIANQKIENEPFQSLKISKLKTYNCCLYETVSRSFWWGTDDRWIHFELLFFPSFLATFDGYKLLLSLNSLKQTNKKEKNGSGKWRSRCKNWKSPHICPNAWMFQVVWNPAQDNVPRWTSNRCRLDMSNSSFKCNFRDVLNMFNLSLLDVQRGTLSRAVHSERNEDLSDKIMM